MGGTWQMRAYMTIFSIFMLAPILVIVGVAFTAGDYVTFPPNGVSLRWFRQVLADQAFVAALLNSLKLGFVSTVVSIVLTVPATVVLVRRRSPIASAIQVFMLSPLSLPTIILAMGLLFLNAKMGLESFWALVAGHTVIVIPYVMRTVFAVYAGANADIEQAALVHGARPSQVFWHVTLPLLRPGLLAGGIFGFLMSFDEISVALLLTDTKTTTLPVMILSFLVNNNDPSVAAVCTIQMLIAVGTLVVLERFFGVRNLMFSAR
jgi:putative spermidine/putrescine transport system permease protein